MLTLSKSQSIFAWKAGTISGKGGGGVHSRRGFEGAFCREEEAGEGKAETPRLHKRALRRMREKDIIFANGTDEHV